MFLLSTNTCQIPLFPAEPKGKASPAGEGSVLREGAPNAQGDASSTKPNCSGSKPNCSGSVACGEPPASLGGDAGLCPMEKAWHPDLLTRHPREVHCEFGGVLMKRGICTLRMRFGPEMMLGRTGLTSFPLSMKENEDE